MRFVGQHREQNRPLQTRCHACSLTGIVKADPLISLHIKGSAVTIPVRLQPTNDICLCCLSSIGTPVRAEAGMTRVLNVRNTWAGEAYDCQGLDRTILM